MKVSIVIPLFKHSNLFNQCMDSLAKYSPEAEIIVIRSNGSFAENCNRGIAAAKGDYICLLNDDIVVTENWLQPLVEVLDNNPSAGAVSPMMLFPPKKEWENVITKSGLQLHQVTDRIITKVQFAGMVFHKDYCGGHLGWGWKIDDPRLPKEVTEFQATTFGCVLLRREALEDICQCGSEKCEANEYGGSHPLDLFVDTKVIDESYTVGGYEDIDTCFKFKQKGWKIFLQPASKIFHYESVSFNSIDQTLRQSASNSNRELYLSRWTPYFENGTFKVDDADFEGGVWNGKVE